jgi:hypothetical protein
MTTWLVLEEVTLKAFVPEGFSVAWACPTFSKYFLETIAPGGQ